MFLAQMYTMINSLLSVTSPIFFYFCLHVGGTAAQFRLLGIVTSVVILRWLFFEKAILNILKKTVWPYIVEEMCQAIFYIQQSTKNCVKNRSGSNSETSPLDIDDSGFPILNRNANNKFCYRLWLMRAAFSEMYDTSGRPFWRLFADNLKQVR